MAEIYNNYDLKKAAPLDAKLKPVTNFTDLANPNTASNFLFLGARVYVTSENADYRVEVDPDNSPDLMWVKQEDIVMVVGSINITPGTTSLDLALVSPTIATCDRVVVNIVNGTSASINSILAFPDDQKIAFSTQAGKTLNFVHTNYVDAVSTQIVLEDGFNMAIKGRQVGDEFVILRKENNVLVQYGATQFMNSAEYTSDMFSVVINNTLTSTSTTQALSAAQGKVLKDLVDIKQKQLSAGQKVVITPGALTDLIAVTPDLATVSVYNSAALLGSGLYGTLLSVLPSSSPITHRYVDLRLAGYGMWLLPANAQPSVAANWIQVEKNDTRSKTASYQLFSDPAFSAALISGKYHPKIAIATLTGDNFVQGFNTDGLADYKYTFSLSPGLYKIRVKLNFRSSHLNDFDFYLYKFNGVNSAATPLTGAVAVDVATAKQTFAAGEKQTQMYLDYVVEVTGATGNGFTMALETTTDFATTIGMGYSSLTIDKIR